MERSYYAVLEISCSASAEEVRAAYRRLALQHHPDKNPSRVAESAEQFKRISEAFSVLRDPKARADYDTSCAAGSVGRRRQAGCTKLGRNTSISFAKAQLLFEEVFGELPSLAVAAEGFASATGLKACAESVGRLQAVREAVAEQKGCVAQKAQADVWEKVLSERKCREEVERHLCKLKEHESSLEAAQELRKARKFSFWEWLQGDQEAADASFDSYAAFKTRNLKKDLMSAESAWMQSLRVLGAAEASARDAQQDMQRVQSCEFVSVSEAVHASTYLLGSFGRLGSAEKGNQAPVETYSLITRARDQSDLVARKLQLRQCQSST
mmetsp:Transcript_91809/g.163392  ORF Transcript_91809/g.163392 Transcript_91809/m.163392 type:complete len:325 (-) Transcript_91809:131-1105(-)